MTSSDVPIGAVRGEPSRASDADDVTGHGSINRVPAKSAQAQRGAQKVTASIDSGAEKSAVAKVDSPMKEGLPTMADAPFELVGWRLSEQNFKSRVT